MKHTYGRTPAADPLHRLASHISTPLPHLNTRYHLKDSPTITRHTRMAATRKQKFTFTELRTQIFENAEFLYPNSPNLKIVTAAGETGQYTALFFQCGYASGFQELKRGGEAPSREVAFEALLDVLQQDVAVKIGDQMAVRDGVKTESVKEET